MLAVTSTKAESAGALGKPSLMEEAASRRDTRPAGTVSLSTLGLSALDSSALGVLAPLPGRTTCLVGGPGGGRFAASPWAQHGHRVGKVAANKHTAGRDWALSLCICFDTKHIGYRTLGTELQASAVVTHLSHLC